MSIRHSLAVGMGILVLSIAWAGCSPDSMVGSRVDNFRAFYNTFYNAQEDFATGMESVEANSHALDPNRFATIFPDPTGNIDESAFESAIERSADVLREHPQSKWVDDALLLIGKSYFYLGEFGAASGKFSEIITLDNERASEARFWRARTLVSQGDVEGAAEYVRVSLERNDVREPWRSQLWLVQAELHTQQGAWPEALSALDAALQGELDRTEATRAQLLRAQILEKRNDYAAAVRAYRAATESREFEVELAGEMGALRVQAQTSTDPSLVEQANALSRDDRNLEQRNVLRVLEAYLHVLQGRPDEARRMYKRLLHGEEPIGRALQSRAYYQMAVMYRDVWNDYGKAAAYFDSSATTASTPEQPSQRPKPPTALPDVEDLADRYGAVAEQQERVARYDSLMTLGTLSDEAFQQRINEIAEARRAAEAEERASDAEQTSRFEGPAQRPGAGRQRRSGASSTIAADAANEESGFLFHRSPQRMQEGRRTFRRRWGTRNREPLWRIADITPDVGQVAAPTVTDAGQVQGEQGESEQDANAASNSSTEDAPETGSSEIDVEAVPRTEAEQEAMRDERTWAWYELGNALFLNINQPDSALTWYDRVLVEAPNHPVYERAVYARAEALEAAGRPGAAQAQYESLIRAHPESPFAERARARIGQAAEPAPDSTQQTLQAYEAARHLADAGEWPEALRQLTDLAQTYRTDAVIGPRALWSMSRVYLKWHRRDSTAARQSLRRAVDTLGIAMDAPESDSTNASTTNASTTNASTTNASTTNASTTDPSSRAERPQRAPMQQIDTPQADTLGLSEAEADSTASTPHIALRALLGHLQATFPDTPQAQRAQRLVQALEGSERAGDDEVAPASNRPSRETPSPQGRLPTPRTSPEENR